MAQTLKRIANNGNDNDWLVIGDTQSVYPPGQSSTEPGKIVIDPVTKEMSISPGKALTMEYNQFLFAASQPLTGTAPAANKVMCTATDNSLFSISADGLITFKKIGFHILSLGRADCSDASLWVPILVSPSGCVAPSSTDGVPHYESSNNVSTTIPPFFIQVNTVNATVQLQWGYWAGSARTVTLTNIGYSKIIRPTI